MILPAMLRVGKHQGGPKQNDCTSLMHAAKRYWHAMEQRGNTKQELHSDRADHRATQNCVPAAPRPYAKGNHRPNVNAAIQR